MTQEHCGPWRRPYNWGLREDPIVEDPKEYPINDKPKEGLSLWNLKTTLSMKILRSFRTFNDFYATKLFGFLVMVYDRVGDGDKFSNGNFGLGRPRFHGTSHLKIETKVFFLQTLCHNVILEYHIIATHVFLKSWIVAQIFFCK